VSAVKLQNAPAVVVTHAKTEAEQIAEAKTRIQILMKILEHPLIQHGQPIFKVNHPLVTKPAAVPVTTAAVPPHAAASKPTTAAVTTHTEKHAALTDLLAQLDATKDGKGDVSTLEKLRQVLNAWSHQHHQAYYKSHGEHHSYVAPVSVEHRHEYTKLPTVTGHREEETDKYKYIHDFLRGGKARDSESQHLWHERANTAVHDHVTGPEDIRYVEKDHKIPVFTDSATALAHGFKQPCAPVHPFYPHCQCNPTTKTWPHCTQEFVPNNEIGEANPGVPVTATEKALHHYIVDPLTSQPVLVPDHKATTTTAHAHKAQVDALHKVLQSHTIPLAGHLHSEPIPLLHQAAIAAAAKKDAGYVVVVDDPTR
jgi:hypothetical protein